MAESRELKDGVAMAAALKRRKQKKQTKCKNKEEEEEEEEEEETCRKGKLTKIETQSRKKQNAISTRKAECKPN
jgi:ribosomal protein L12E/L44/L45/RPP1/RPP2